MLRSARFQSNLVFPEWLASADPMKVSAFEPHEVQERRANVLDFRRDRDLGATGLMPRSGRTLVLHRRSKACRETCRRRILESQRDCRSYLLGSEVFGSPPCKILKRTRRVVQGYVLVGFEFSMGRAASKDLLS